MTSETANAKKDRTLSPEELADYLNVSLSTVYHFNSERTGPKFTRVGIRVRYRKSDVDAWFDAGGTGQHRRGRH